MNGVFITGTDTGIGKTVLSALLLAVLRRSGINAAPMKPVQTGCVKLDAGRSMLGQASSIQHPVFSAPDLDYSLSMASMNVSEEAYSLMSPFRFEPACSPHLAAGMAGTEIDIAGIVIAARKLAEKYDFLIAEGAGGIVVPLNRRETMLDLMQALKFPVLIAARPGLGTINHTLLSIRALRTDGLDIAGVVFSASTDTEAGFIEEDNVTAIEDFGKVPVLGTVPHCAALADPLPRFDALPPQVVEETEGIIKGLGM